MTRASRIRWALLVAGFAGRAWARGQDFGPNTLVIVPTAGHGLAEASYSLYRPEAFVRRDGIRQKFPGDLRFELALLRLSYSPFRNVAFGIEVPYRWTTYDEPGLEASFASRGSPGVVASIDWSPAKGGMLRPALRIEYARARSETDQILTVSDGVNRFAATFQLTDRGGALPAHWRGAAQLRLEYGPPVEASPHHLESRLELRAGPRILHQGSANLHLLAALGYRAASAARQEGNFFHDRTSQGAFAGLLLSSEFGREAAFSLSLSALRDIRPRNALSGWRVTLSLTSGF